MLETSALIDRYCEVWSEPDAQRRAALLAPIWSAAATYTDPTVHAADAAQLLSHIASVHAQCPNASILRTSRVDVHHGVVRFNWHLVPANGIALPEGLDIAFLSPDGASIERVIGFFGPLRTVKRAIVQATMNVIPQPTQDGE